MYFYLVVVVGFKNKAKYFEKYTSKKQTKKDLNILIHEQLKQHKVCGS